MNHLLKAISEANNFLLKETDIDNALQNCITALGKNIEINRCYIFKNEIENDKLVLNYEYEWCCTNTIPFIGSPDLSGHTYDAFPGLFEPLSQNNPVSKAVANGGPKRKPNSVLVSVTLKNDAIGSEKPNANALRLGDSVPISQ